MLKRDRLNALLEKLTDQQFNAVWKDTYGYSHGAIVQIWRGLCGRPI